MHKWQKEPKENWSLIWGVTFLKTLHKNTRWELGAGMPLILDTNFQKPEKSGFQRTPRKLSAQTYETQGLESRTRQFSNLKIFLLGLNAGVRARVTLVTKPSRQRNELARVGVGKYAGTALIIESILKRGSYWKYFYLSIVLMRRQQCMTNPTKTYFLLLAVMDN